MAEERLVTEAQLVAFAKKTDERLDALELGVPEARTLTLAASGWTADSGDANYPYQYRLTVPGVTEASRADALLDAASVAAAADCSLCAATETAANTVIFKARKAPAAALTGTLYITRTAR